MSSKVRSWLWDAQNVKVEQFVADDPTNMSLYGLEPPQLCVKVWLNGQEQPQELLFGDVDAENTGIYANKIGSQNSIVLVKSEAFDDLSKTANDFRDRQILTLETEAIVKIQIAYTDTTLLLEKKGDIWKVQEPEKQELTGYKVNNLLYDIEALEFTTDIQSPDADMSVYGLEQPAVEITLWEQGRKEGFTIQIGKVIEGVETRYFKRVDMPTVYVIDAAFLNELPRTLADLIE
jgi:hypothetical protein